MNDNINSKGDNLTKTKLSKVKITIIIFDIISVIILVIFFYSWYQKKYRVDHNNETKETTIISDYKQTFKKYTYNIPAKLIYTEYGKDRFSLESEFYNASVEIYADQHKNLYNHSELFYKALLDSNYKVDEPEIVKIDDVEVIIYKKYEENNNVLICQFYTDFPFVYNIELHNNDNSFEQTYIREIMSILLNAEFDKNSNKKYSYPDMDVSGIFKDITN